MKRAQRRIALSLGFIAVLSFIFASYAFFAQPAKADTVPEITKQEIAQHARWYALHACYTNREGETLRKEINYHGHENSYKSVFEGDAQIFKYKGNIFGIDNHFLIDIPTGFVKDVISGKEMGDIPCAHKSDDYHGADRQLYPGNEPDASSNKQRTQYYEGMGYTSSLEGEGGEGEITINKMKCWHLNYTVTSTPGNTNAICFGLDADGKVVAVDSGDVAMKAAETYRLYFFAKKGSEEIKGDPNYNGDRYETSSADVAVSLVLNVSNRDTANDFSGIVHDEIYGTTSAPKYADMEAEVKEFLEEEDEAKYLNNTWWTKYGSWEQASKVYHDTFAFSASDLKITEKSGEQIDPTSQKKNLYKISDGEAGYKSAYKYLTGKTSATDEEATKMRTLDPTQAYYVYITYLGKYDGGNGAKINYSGCKDQNESSGDTQYIPVVTKDDEGKKVWKWCQLDKFRSTVDKGENINLSVRDGGGKWDENGRKYEYIVTLLQGIDYNSLEIERLPAKQTEQEAQQQGEGDEQNKENCYKNAGSLGWILCPIIESSKTAIIENYGTIVEPALQIDNGLFRAGKITDNGTYLAWDIFRNIGNAAFVILFIFVIISQVTGFGLDNYGVKKSLPKLLVAAILINLSFIICQGAIDICNITGKGIGGLFQAITYQIEYPKSLDITIGGETTTVSATDEESWQDTNTWGTSFAENWLGNSAIVIIVAALGVGTVLSQGLAILIPIAMLLISVLVAIFGLIAILGIRQAVAVLLVVVSPLAFACYILPNTKKIYDKWFTTFKGLLLAYPICSALVYGGDMAATILLKSASGNLWVVISAAVIAVAPIFIIPKVIRSSMGALSGGIAMLSQRMGGYVKGKARGRMEQSALTNRRNYNQMMRSQKHAASGGAYNAKRGAKTVAALRNNPNMTTAQRRKYNVAMGAVNANNADATNAYTSSYVGKSDTDIIADMVKYGAGDKPDANRIVAGLNSIHDEDKLTSAIRQLADTGALDKIHKQDPDSYQRIASAMASRKDSVINQSIGKLMAKGESIQEMYGNGDLKKKVQGAGISVMATQNKDVFATEGAADLFSNDQLRAGLTAGYSGSTAASFYDMMSGVSEERKQSIVEGMSAEEVASLGTASIVVMKKDENGNVVGEEQREVGSMAAIGSGDGRSSEAAFQHGAEIVKAQKGDAINQLNSDEGREIRPTMEGKVMDALGIKHDEPAAAGGGNENPNGSTISSGINVNDMTEDDYKYIQWQHDRNPSDEAKAAIAAGANPGEVGFDIDHGDSAKQPDLSSTEHRGSKRDEDGHVVGERAKEGNFFDYHPKQQGETNADYSERSEYYKAMQAYGEANPKMEGETTQEYTERIQAPSQEEWVKSGKGEIKLPAERGNTEPEAPKTDAPKMDEPKPADEPKSEPPKGDPTVTDPTTEPAPVIPDGPDHNEPIFIPHGDTPNPDAHIELLGDKPNPDAHIDLLEPKPNPDAHIDLPGPKPNPNAHIDLLEPKPNPNAHIDLPYSAAADPSRHLDLSSDKFDATRHIEMGADRFNHNRRNSTPGMSFNANRRSGGSHPTISTNHHH